MSDHPTWIKKPEEGGGGGGGTNKAKQNTLTNSASSNSNASPSSSRRIKSSLSRKAGPLRRVLKKHLGVGFGAGGGGSSSWSTGEEEEDLEEEEDETEEETWKEEEELYFGNRVLVKGAKATDEVDGIAAAAARSARAAQIYDNVVAGGGKVERGPTTAASTAAEFDEGGARQKEEEEATVKSGAAAAATAARVTHNGIKYEHERNPKHNHTHNGNNGIGEATRMKESNGHARGGAGDKKRQDEEEEDSRRRQRQPPLQRQERSRDDVVDRAAAREEESGEEMLRALISPSAPSPEEGDLVSAERKRVTEVVTAPAATDLGSLSECCRERERRRLNLQAERDALRSALKATTEELSRKEEDMVTKVGDLNRSYEASLAEMKNLLSTQRKVGNQWKGEMEILTQQFEVKLKTLQVENRKLRTDLDAAMNELELKEADLHEATEMNGIYSAKLTKLERKFKKLKDEDEESYMEMTF